MNKTLSLVALTMMTGCLRTAGTWEGIWFIQMPATAEDTLETDIDENFKDAAPYDDQEVVVGEWEYTTEFEGSDSGIFMQVLMQNGNAIGVIGDTVYTGTATAKDLTLTWESFEDSESKSVHENGYEFNQITSGKTTETFTLTKGKKNTYTGTFATNSVEEITYVESDEWDRQDIQLENGTIPSSILEGNEIGDNVNVWDIDDCSGDECEITVTETYDLNLETTAIFAGKHNEGMFTSVEDASRGPGLGY